MTHYYLHHRRPRGPGRAQAARAAHAPPLPGPHARLRRQRALVGPDLRHADTTAAPRTVTDAVLGAASDTLPAHVRVAVIGSGFSGIGLAIRLKQAGIHDFVMLERADDLGGTWRDNTYPGCRCDVPSHLYSFSFARNPDWSRSFSGQQEIWDYLRRVSDSHGVTRHIRYGAEMTSAEWEAGDERWRVETVRGTLTADFLVSGAGLLSDPATPRLPGIDAFRGKTFHSAHWDHDHDLAGQRVAVIGTGASAIQFVPEIQPVVGRMHVFQRTAPWVMPRGDREITSIEKRLFRSVGAAQLLARAAIYAGRETSVLGLHAPAPDVARREVRIASPEKQVARSRAARAPAAAVHARLQAHPDQRRLVPGADTAQRRARDRRDRRGARALDRHRRRHRARGRHDHLRDRVPRHRLADGRPRPRARRPHAARGLGRQSTGLQGNRDRGLPQLLHAARAEHRARAHFGRLHERVADRLHRRARCSTRRSGAPGALEVRPEALDAYVRELDSELASAVWSAGGCRSWYLDSTGRNAALWPGFTFRFRERVRRFDPEHVPRRGAAGGRRRRRSRRSSRSPAFGAAGRARQTLSRL